MATKRNAGNKKKTSIAVDFTDTETQATLEEGDYLFEVDEVEQKTSDNSGADYLSFKFKVADGPFEGKVCYHNCSLQPQALFNLRGVLEALGFEVPKGVMELDPADCVGEKCGGTVSHETYEGKKRPRIVEFFPAEELETPEDPPAKPTKAVKKAKDEPEAEPPAKGTVKKKGKPAAPAIEEGDAVTFTDEEGKEQTGEVIGIEDDTYTVKVGVGKKAEEWELELGDLTLVE